MQYKNIPFFTFDINILIADIQIGSSIFSSVSSLSHQLKRPVYLLRLRIISLQFDRIAKFRFCQAEFP